MDILSSFDERINTLENDIANIHKDTTRMKLIHASMIGLICFLIIQTLNRASLLLNEYLKYLMWQPNKREGSKKGKLHFGLFRNVRSIRGDLESYMEAMDKVSEAMSYLTRNKNFKSAEKALAVLVSETMRLRNVYLENTSAKCSYRM